MTKNYNIYRLLLIVTNHLFMDDGSYDREVNMPYIKALAHVQWRMSYLSNLLDKCNCPRIAQVISDFEDLLLEAESYYTTQIYPDMRKRLLEIEKQVLRDTMSEDIKSAYRIEVVQGSDVPLNSDTLKSLFSVFQVIPMRNEDVNYIYTEFEEEYKDLLDSDNKVVLREEDVYKIIKAAMHTTFDLEEDK